MKICHYCGELKSCKKGDISYIYNCQDNTEGLWTILPHYFNWICEECSKAQDIEYTKYKKEVEKKEREEKLKWIKKRDKILKENKI